MNFKIFRDFVFKNIYNKRRSLAKVCIFIRNSKTTSDSAFEEYYDGIINRTGNVNLLADFYIMKSASR